MPGQSHLRLGGHANGRGFPHHPVLGLPFYFRFFHLGKDGQIVATGYSSVSVDHCGGWLGHGDWLAHFDANGNMTSMSPTPDSAYGAANPDQSSNPQYMLTAEMEFMHVLSADGLEIVNYTYGQGTPYEAAYGWTDMPFGVGGFVHPLTGKMYVYTEEIYFGQALRFRVDNLASIQRQQGTFSYTAPTGRPAADFRRHA